MCLWRCSSTLTPLFLCCSSLQVQEDSGDAFPGRTEDDRGSEYNEHGPQQEDRRHEVQCDRANMATAPAQLQEQMSAGTCGLILTPSPARQPGDAVCGSFKSGGVLGLHASPAVGLAPRVTECEHCSGDGPLTWLETSTLSRPRQRAL